MTDLVKGENMDIYSYFNSKTVGEYCRSIGHKFNAYETGFIINECNRISIEKKLDLYREIMETMSDVRDERLKKYTGSDSFFHALKNVFIPSEQTAYEQLIHADRNGMFCQYGYYHYNNKFTDDTIYTSYGRAYEVLKENISDSEPDEYRGLFITAKIPDADKYITGQLNDNLEVNTLWYNCHEEIPLFDILWVYIPTPFKKGDILIPCATFYPAEPMVLNDICYWGKDEEWLKKRKIYADFSDMTAYGYWLGNDGQVYEECVHDYHNLEYFTGEFFRLDLYNPKYKDHRLLKTLSAVLKGEIDIEVLVTANNLLKAENDLRKNFPAWNAKYYEKAGIPEMTELEKMLIKQHF
ncbi:MAG: hypothetical protein E7494_13960 [Ruminococcus albus]|nr:hypothetical protein [Ruminococcus albus]